MDFVVNSSGWAAVALIVAAAIAGIWRRRSNIHYVLGFASLALASIHLWYSMGTMGARVTSAYANGLDAATLALLLLGGQTFVGWRLQRPGKLRTTLRATHICIVAALVATIAYHVIENGST